jgi:hypothetical protein
VEALVGVLVQVVQVERRRFGQVVGGELELSHLSGDDRLRGRGERRVAHRERLLVRERARLLPRGERLVREVQRQHEIRLLHDLLAVQIEVREVVMERVPLRPCRREVPAREIGPAG